MDDRPAEGQAKERYSTAVMVRIVLSTTAVTGSLFYRLLPAVTYSVPHCVQLDPFPSPGAVTLSKSLSLEKAGSGGNIPTERLHVSTYSHFI